MSEYHHTNYTISNALTCGRIVLVPCIMYALASHAWWWALVFLCVACVSDMLDGALARWRNERTVLGTYLDPLADKLLIVGCLATLMVMHASLIPWWFLGLVMIKELVVVCGALFVYCYTGSLTIKPTMLGKCTTAVLMLFITVVFVCCLSGYDLQKINKSMILIMVILLCATIIQYIGVGIEQLRK